MKFLVAAGTDTGIGKETNQDSLLVKHANSNAGEVLLAIICDGIGGLFKGELASAVVIREFSKWFDRELGKELQTPDMEIIGEKWVMLLQELNYKIRQYAEDHQCKMGTTFSGILLVDTRFVIVHVGDTRIYQIDHSLRQITRDHTFVKREVDRGNLTEEQARTDKRRNLLLQCVGASESMKPEILSGVMENGIMLLCSDGFYNKLSEQEILAACRPENLENKKGMRQKIKELIKTVKSRNERDDISAILIKIDRKV